MNQVIIILVIGLFFSLHSYSQALQIFGGQEHTIYLGCLNCSNSDAESIWNVKSNYGNNQQAKSIWNDKGAYGSLKSNYSPWNKLAKYPPVLKDNDGEFYGYLSTNDVNGYRAHFTLVKKLYESHNLIKLDVENWYNKIFNKNLADNRN